MNGDLREDLRALKAENSRLESQLSDAQRQIAVLTSWVDSAIAALEPVLAEYDADGECALPEIVSGVVADLLRLRDENKQLRQANEEYRGWENWRHGLWLIGEGEIGPSAEYIGSVADAEALKKLPRTRDGKLVVPGMTLYVLKYGRHAFSAENFHWKIDSYPDQAFVRGYWGTSGYDSDFRWSNCYSTREAAEAAENSDA